MDMREYSVFYRGSVDEFRENYINKFNNYNCKIKDFIDLDKDLLILFSAPVEVEGELEKIIYGDEVFSFFEVHPRTKMIEYGPQQSKYPEGKG